MSEHIIGVARNFGAMGVGGLFVVTGLASAERVMFVGAICWALFTVTGAWLAVREGAR